MSHAKLSLYQSFLILDKFSLAAPLPCWQMRSSRSLVFHLLSLFLTFFVPYFLTDNIIISFIYTQLMLRYNIQ